MGRRKKPIEYTVCRNTILLDGTLTPDYVGFPPNQPSLPSQSSSEARNSAVVSDQYHPQAEEEAECNELSANYFNPVDGGHFEEVRSQMYHHTIHFDRTVLEKLADALNVVLKLVWVSADGREGHYCQPCYNRETAEIDWTSYSFVGFRFVAFSQETRLISWCSNQNCGNSSSREGMDECFQGVDYPDAAADEHLQSMPSLCSCSEVLLNCEGGEAALKAWLRRARQQTAVQEGSVVVEHEMQGQQLLIVRPGSSFRDWGVLHKKSAGRVECRTCVRNKKHCKHANYVRDRLEDVEESSTAMRAEDFWRKVCQEFDPNTGQRRLKCISKKQIPDGQHKDACLFQIAHDRQCGVAGLPSVIEPSPDQPCPCCQGTDWSTNHVGEECTVFLLGAAVQVRFASRTCRQPRCQGRLDVDGIEWALLRKTAGYAFGHELLWDWSNKTATGGTPWYTHFRDAIMRYKAPGLQKSRWLHSVRDTYEQATLDFVQLQCIDYAAEFGCQCNAGIIADGITLGFHKSQAYLVNPAQAVREAIVSAEQLVRGSLFEDRTFVKNASIRKLLLQFASAGLAEDEHAALLEELESMDEESLE